MSTAQHPLTETDAAEPLARTLLGVPEGYGAPHHDAGRIKAGDFVVQVDRDGFIRAGIAHRQDGDGDWLDQYNFPLTQPAARADRPDALTIWPAPTLTPPTNPGTVIVTNDGHEYITATLAGVTYRAREAILVGEDDWYAAWRSASKVMPSVAPEQIDPGTWKKGDR